MIIMRSLCFLCDGNVTLHCGCILEIMSSELCSVDIAYIYKCIQGITYRQNIKYIPIERDDFTQIQLHHLLSRLIKSILQYLQRQLRSLSVRIK